MSAPSGPVPAEALCELADTFAGVAHVVRSIDEGRMPGPVSLTVTQDRHGEYVVRFQLLGEAA